MNHEQLIKKLLILIGDCIDEESLPGIDSFVEMEGQVIHYSGAEGDRYFKVKFSLEEVDEREYLP